jgi:hypothetical protein
MLLAQCFTSFLTPTDESRFRDIRERSPHIRRLLGVSEERGWTDIRGRITGRRRAVRATDASRSTDFADRFHGHPSPFGAPDATPMRDTRIDSADIRAPSKSLPRSVPRPCGLHSPDRRNCAERLTRAVGVGDGRCWHGGRRLQGCADAGRKCSMGEGLTMALLHAHPSLA